MQALLLCAAMAGGSALPHGAAAADASQGMDVRLEVRSRCVLSSASAAVDLSFGTHISFGGEPTDAPIDGQAAVQLTCDSAMDWSVYADLGQNAAGSAQRQLLDSTSGALLAYGLYADAGRSQPLGSTPAGALSGSGTGAEQTLLLYGRIPTGTRLPAAGSYRDTVVLTFWF
ncbi:fimbrial major subunit CsuA/B family protein [Xylophilus rhododendri]|uniref:Fimbrial major subunit CsuA/B family protein n=1 Tax=Xylophilus rhododendri TaxID=2697032 RepID=A0A857J1E2_9BURK|nr:spore coat U domain-containing protein [Xylophilus rhododendri]QHI96788.1 fimbrial major subunit CsuA/B family protein [Xylophilus rhododendri]